MESAFMFVDRLISEINPGFPSNKGKSISDLGASGIKLIAISKGTGIGIGSINGWSNINATVFIVIFVSSAARSAWRIFMSPVTFVKKRVPPRLIPAPLS